MSLDAKDAPARVVVVKLGGSVLTAKGDTERVLNHEGLVAVRRVARQCAARGVRLVLVTGAGSFGHVLAKRHGFRTAPVATSLSVDRVRQALEIHRSVQDLARIVETDLCQAGHVAMSISYTRWELHELQFCKRVTAEINHLHELGVIPIFYGDMQLSHPDAFVLSGDTIAPFLANLFGCGLVMVSRYVLYFPAPLGSWRPSHCLHTADPSSLSLLPPVVKVLNPATRLCRTEGSPEWVALDTLAVGAAWHDVSGGMFAKVRSAMQFCLQPHLPKVAIVAAHDVDDVMDSVLNAVFESAKDDDASIRSFTLLSAGDGQK